VQQVSVDIPNCGCSTVVSQPPPPPSETAVHDTSSHRCRQGPISLGGQVEAAAHCMAHHYSGKQMLSTCYWQQSERGDLPLYGDMHVIERAGL
jgi:hypothetical protein